MGQILQYVKGLLFVVFLCLPFYFRIKGILKSTGWTVFGFFLIAIGASMLVDAVASVLISSGITYGTFRFTVTYGAILSFVNFVVFAFVGMLIAAILGFKELEDR